MAVCSVFNEKNCGKCMMSIDCTCTDKKQNNESEEKKMKNRTWIQKLTSRKLWVSVGSFVSMMIVATGGTESEAAQVAALIMAGATMLAYVVGEGLVDSANKEVETVKSEETVTAIGFELPDDEAQD